MSVWNFLICTGNLVILLIKDFYVPKNLKIHLSTTIAQNSAMGLYFQNFNPLLFTKLSLPRTKIRPKHSEGVVWAQSKGHFRTQHPWKPLHNMLLVWPYLWILMFWNFLSFGVIYLIGGQLATSRHSWVVVYIYEMNRDCIHHPIFIYMMRIACFITPFSVTTYQYIYVSVLIRFDHICSSSRSSSSSATRDFWLQSGTGRYVQIFYRRRSKTSHTSITMLQSGEHNSIFPHPIYLNCYKLCVYLSSILQTQQLFTLFLIWCSKCLYV